MLANSIPTKEVKILMVSLASAVAWLDSKETVLKFLEKIRTDQETSRTSVHKAESLQVSEVLAPLVK